MKYPDLPLESDFIKYIIEIIGYFMNQIDQHEFGHGPRSVSGNPNIVEFTFDYELELICKIDYL